MLRNIVRASFYLSFITAMTIIIGSFIVIYFVVGQPYRYEENSQKRQYYVTDYWNGVHEVKQDEYLRAEKWWNRIGKLGMYVVIPCVLYLAIHRAFLRYYFDPDGPFMNMS